MFLIEMKNVGGQNLEQSEVETLQSQALIVTCGPFEGRVCLNDDDEFVPKSQLPEFDLEWIEEHGVIWSRLDDDDNFDPEFDIGVHCEIVTFGYYLQCRGTYSVPRQFLRPATTKDLVQRHQEISDQVFRSAWRKDNLLDDDEVISLLKEEIFITNELWERENYAKETKSPRNVFLCHSSADKPFVKQVCNDLAKVGHKPWLDEFEIRVGESIVDKINEGTSRAGALIVFLSKTAISSSWVKREWNSALARQLAAKSVVVLPALIEDCKVPAILSDIKFADFRNSYMDGLSELTLSLENLKQKKRSRKKS